MSWWPDPALAALAENYPERPVVLEHGLGDHPLLELTALLALADRMRPDTVEHNLGALPIGVDPTDVPANGLDAVETLAGIATNRSWMVLKFIEQDPLYEELLADALTPINAAIRPVTGPMLKREGFIFVSSPGSVTPYHMDPEHNILMQIRGAKTFTVWPAGDERYAPAIEHERFHAGGHRNLPWDDGFLPAGRAHHLSAGQAIHVPVKGPHFVRNGPEVSVSLSVTWRSAWSYREQYAHGWNGLLRARGLHPAPPRRHPRGQSCQVAGLARGHPDGACQALNGRRTVRPIERRCTMATVAGRVELDERPVVRRYGEVARWFHWTIALLIIGNLLVGFFHESLPKAWIGTVMSAHKAIGLTVLALSLARLTWRLGHPAPRQMPNHAAWERSLATATHWTLYAFMVLMPLAGWLMVSAAEARRPLDFFGVFPLPYLPTGANETLAGIGHEAHEIIGWGFVALLLLHVGGALKHQWLDGDHTLGRMVGWMRAPDPTPDQ